MLIEIIKKITIKIGIWAFSFFPENYYLKKIKKKFFLADLRRTDWALWNVEKAISMGVKVGKNCRFYSINFFSEPYLVEIGNDVIVSGEVIFVTHDGSVYLLKGELPNIRGYYGRIKIGNNCFIGMGAIILPNVEVGNNCIIGAGSVVSQSFPDNSVIMGNPAKVVFKTELYKKMRTKSKNIVFSDEYPFPKRIPDSIKKKIILEKNDIPKPAKSRKYRKC